MSFRIEVGSGITLSLDEATARDIVAQLDAQGIRADKVRANSPNEQPTERAPGAASAAFFPDDHPIWAQTSRARFADEVEWDVVDQPLAEVFYGALKGNAKTFIDALIDNPGRPLSVDDLCQLAPEAFPHGRSVTTTGTKKAQRALLDSGRPVPYHSWINPTRYGMKSKVAGIFREARARLQGL